MVGGFTIRRGFVWGFLFVGYSVISFVCRLVCRRLCLFWRLRVMGLRWDWTGVEGLNRVRVEVLGEVKFGDF